MRNIPLLIILLLCGCATVTGPLVIIEHIPPGTGAVEWVNTPFIAQERYQSGPASLAMLLQESGVDVSAEELAPRVYNPKFEGSLQAEMIAATREFSRLAYQISPTLEALLAELRLGRPVLVLQDLSRDASPVWRYAVVIGYLPESDQIVLRSGETYRELKSVHAFLDDWARARNWGMLALLPGTLPADFSAPRFLRATAGLEATGKMAAAASAYSSATDRWPEETESWLGLGNAKYAQEDLLGAERTYRQALENSGNNPVVRNNLAQVLAEQGCKDAAYVQLKLALDVASRDLDQALFITRQEIAAMPDRLANCVRD